MFKMTPLWKIQKKQECDTLRAILGPAIGNAVIRIHEGNLKNPCGSSSSQSKEEEEWRREQEKEEKRQQDRELMDFKEEQRKTARTCSRCGREHNCNADICSNCFKEIYINNNE